MLDSEICQYFATLPIEELRSVQLLSGRAAVGNEVRQSWAKVHTNALEVLKDDRRSHRAMALAEFARVITSSLAHLTPADTRPTYYTYTDVAILDWFCNQDRPTYFEKRTSSLIGILYLLEDVGHFESSSQTGLEKRFRRSFDRDISAERLALIEAVVAKWERGAHLMSMETVDKLRHMKHCETIPEYVDDPDRKAALIRFSCFPQTDCHDEYLFLRTIHMSELAFMGIGAAVEEAIECLKVREYAAAAEALEQAATFAEILHSIFRVLYTMPADHFGEFREATGDASAVQSQTYQLMEIFCFGVNEQKLSTFSRYTHLSSLRRYKDPRFVSLQSILSQIAKDVAAAKTLECARQFDKALLMWRGLHIAFAKKYLPPSTVGTGGTSGASYLERFLKSTIFPDTKFEPKRFTEHFPDFADVLESMMLHAPTSTIAPRIE